MRDTQVLRDRLQAAALTSLGLSALTFACDDGTSGAPRPTARATEETATKADPAVKPPIKVGKERVSDGPQIPFISYDNILEGDFDYYGLPRDPWTEHDEEEGCPQGDWCGTPADAALFAPKGGVEQMGCPGRIVQDPKAQVDKKAKKWKGFSFHDLMQGRFVGTVTHQQREEQKREDICCYHWFEYCSGRPLLEGDDAIVAASRMGCSWSETSGDHASPGDVDLECIDPELRAHLGDLWLTDALQEHASIAAFARATLELLAVAAPPELIAGCQEATLDEIRHTARCFTLSERYSGIAREPAPLPAPLPRAADLARLAVDTFLEGCVGETIAALCATRAGRHCKDSVVSQALEMIAEDEARHAALAWKTIAWCISTGGARVVEALHLAASSHSSNATDADSRPSLLSMDPLSSHGRLSEQQLARARADAWLEIILPTLSALTNSGSSLRQLAPDSIHA